jgi:hypothetical protein
MPLRYLVDENLRGTLAIALSRHATRLGLTIDVVQVGDKAAPPLATLDPALLLWAEAENRILISTDRRTLAAHLAEHLKDGHQSPGIFLLRRDRLVTIVDYLLMLAYASEPSEFTNKISYVP